MRARIRALRALCLCIRARYTVWTSRRMNLKLAILALAPGKIQRPDAGNSGCGTTDMICRVSTGGDRVASTAVRRGMLDLPGKGGGAALLRSSRVVTR
jgi:hypothetical protein